LRERHEAGAHDILSLMNIYRVPLGEIDFGDERFRISEELNLPGMQDSLREIGQLNPVLLLGREQPGWVIVCGFRRLHALRRIGASHALACTRAAVDLGPLEAFRSALWDNIAHRQLEALEKARCLWTLKDAYGVPQDVLVQEYLPPLGLASHPNVLHSYLSLYMLNPQLRVLFKSGKLTLSSAQCLAGMKPASQERIAPVLARLHLSASLQREVLELAEELAAISGTDPGEVLGDEGITAVVDEPRLSPSQKGERVREILRCRRNPRLSRAKDLFLAERKKLGLPGAVHITPDPFFETPRLRVEFEATSVGGFRELAAALQQASQSPVLDGLFRMQ